MTTTVEVKAKTKEQIRDRLIIGILAYLARNGNVGVAYGKRQTPTNLRVRLGRNCEYTVYSVYAMPM
jgi:hypothetical protein